MKWARLRRFFEALLLISCVGLVISIGYCVYRVGFDLLTGAEKALAIYAKAALVTVAPFVIIFGGSFVGIRIIDRYFK